MSRISNHFSKRKIVKPLIALYFFVALLDVIVEYFRDAFYIVMFKPLLMPLLISVYYFSSIKPNRFFIAALVSIWMSNLFFITNSIDYTIIAAIFFLIYRILIIYFTHTVIPFPGKEKIAVASIPFLILYFTLGIFIYKEMNHIYFHYVLLSIFMIYFGGYCLAVYLIKEKKTNLYLLMSTLLFTLIHILIIFKIYFSKTAFIQSLVMTLFVIAQYQLLLFVLLEEKKRKYPKVNNPQANN